MTKVKLREAAQPEQGRNDATVADAAAIPLKPLRISGIVVRKADLIEALRIYTPTLRDLQVTEDGEHFWLILGEGGSDGDSAAQ